MGSDEDFQRAVEAVYATFGAFGAGDAAPFAALWSRGDDVTIFGGFGAYERGWAEVGPRLDWAASRLGGGDRLTVQRLAGHASPDTTSQYELLTAGSSYELLAAGSGGDLGYAVSLDRMREGAGVLRVTHLFRREDGAWRIIHRHADPIAAKTAPEAILPQ